ncbi:MAG: hypothetical protein OHK003_17390 [Anaerolineales bacterium]
MKIKLISTLGILFLLLNLLPSAQVTPALAQTCTDAAGGVIPCPTEAPPTGGGGSGSEDGSDTSSGGSNPTKPELLFLGNNENYLDPANWNNGGRIPGADDSARLDGLTAVIDPLDPTPIPLGDLTLRNGAKISIYDATVIFNILDVGGCERNATKLHNTTRARKLYQSKYIKEANTKYYSTLLQGQTLLLSADCGMNLETSLLDARRILVQDPNSFIQLGLGGNQPASPNGRGSGHYARMQGNSIDLDGQLNLFFVYGFHPDPGDTFEIITNIGGNPINGTFANAPEGSVLNGFCDVQFRITYIGGDGNDVVLTAETPTQPDPNCDEDFSDPRADGNVLLDASSIDLEPDQPIEVQDIQLVNGAEWNLYNGIVTARIIDSTNSAINLFNSHLKTGIFIDPGGYGGGGGILLNPSFIEAERIVLYKPETPARFGLGGDQPASPEGRGPGHFANMQGRSIDLDGQLDLFFVYGFRPQPGQTFQIITNTGGNPINGTFANAPEGSVLNGFCDVQFRITYIGGDGNDVVLTAETPTQPDPYCNEDFSDPHPDKNIFLDASSVDVQPDRPLEVNDIQLVNGAEWNLRNGVVTARVVDSNGSAINLFNSHLKTDIFIDPVGGYSLNPSFLEAEYAVLYESETVSSFGIGGTEQAGENKLGKGHYAHLQADRIRLGGKLEVFFVYDFVPQPGQTFQIITVNHARLGEFENAPEGSVVGGYCDVELVISYTGGDGNDIVLTAQKSANPNPEWECASTSEPQPEPAQESNTPANLTPYLIGGAVLVLIVLLAIFLRKRSA